MFGWLSRLFGSKDPASPVQVDLTPFLAAIEANDFEALEGLRDAMNADVAAVLVGHWSPGDDWPRKDAFVAVLMDQTVARLPTLEPVMRDALDSPTVESRAYALCSLTGDYAQFEGWLAKGWVDGDAVDASIAAWRGQGALS